MAEMSDRDMSTFVFMVYKTAIESIFTYMGQFINQIGFNFGTSQRYAHIHTRGGRVCDELNSSTVLLWCYVEQRESV